MAKKTAKESLADKIAGVLNTAPVSFDPEDEDLDSTRAQLLDADLFDEYDHDEEKLLSVFRKQNIDLLSDVDPRYAGKKTSRKKLAESDEPSDSDVSTDEGGSSTFAIKKSGNKSEEKQSDEHEEEIVSEDDEESGEEESEKEEGNEDEIDDEEGSTDVESDFVDDTNEPNEDHFKAMNETDLSAQVKKGLCVRNQISMWENLLEMRIQLQKCLITANKMPQKHTLAEIKKNAGEDFSNQVAVTKNSLTNVLDKLLLLQQLVLGKYPETKNLDKKAQRSANEDDNEEIPSDTDDEKSVDAVEEEEQSERIPVKKRKLNEFEKELSERHDKYKNYRNSVIQKWNEKTRIAVMKNNANYHLVVNHIEHILGDKAKLIKRSQLKRSEYTILGQESAENKEQEDVENDGRTSEEYNTEIYDDDDFYHQLLRDLIEVKSADVTDPVQLSRQWIQLQSLRSKMKRKIDTRATKGRKIRYAVHSKLVNFMAPIDENLWTDEAKNELFSSLFGKRHRINIV